VAKTKTMQCRFIVKEGADITHEPREGRIELWDVVFITAEPCGREPVEARPLQGPDFLSFALNPGTSLGKAQEIADFLNENLSLIAITRFGDTEDLAREVTHSERLQQIDAERFANLTSSLREKLAAQDCRGAAESLKAVESVIGNVHEGWLKALALSRVILQRFGQNGDHDAA
jgi:hypothetical protein